MTCGSRRRGPLVPLLAGKLVFPHSGVPYIDRNAQVTARGPSNVDTGLHAENDSVDDAVSRCSNSIGMRYPRAE
ncbi:hypothetical protein R1CP_39630 (plasmid) [Rhodococcus opacus]|uniref:Uncharacterized protein n=1 Tax=Rhodococcus opacus TaxID=37919 RepID=A0A1B1KIS0_RHOOP|nr:hypothetical protein R1CP_39630 [Rhodococcus opacus]